MVPRYIFTVTTLSSKARVVSAILFATTLVVSLALHLRLVEYADDDAYIHMRVAKNLWLFGEPYFNRGEPVMASTSPLWLILTSSAAAGGALQTVVVCVLNAIILAALAFVWSSVYSRVVESPKRLERWVAGAIVFFTAAPASVGLMETPCALLFVGLGFLGVLKERWWGIPSSVAAVFVRPECAVFCVAALALKFLRRQRWRIVEAVAGIAPAAFFLSWQLHHFGSLYPHTAHVKEIVYDLSTGDFVRFAFIAGYGEWTVRAALPYLVVAMIFAALWAIVRFKGKVSSPLHARGARELDFAIIFVVPAVVILSVYTVKQVFIFPWYAPLFLVPIHLVVLRILVRGGGALSLLLLAPLAIVSYQILAALIAPSYAPFFEAGARARHLKRVAASLSTEFPQAVIMAPEIGALGFEFSGKIIDAVGLASPEALPFHPLRVPEQRPTGFHGGVPAAFVERELPSLVVGLDAFMQDFLRSPVSAAYEIRRLPPFEPDDLIVSPTGKAFGSTALVVAIKRDGSPGAPQER